MVGLKATPLADELRVFEIHYFGGASGSGIVTRLAIGPRNPGE